MKSKKHVQPFYWLVTRFLKSKTETSEHTEPFVQLSWQGSWKYSPSKINSEKSKNIVNARAHFHERFFVQRGESWKLIDIE